MVRLSEGFLADFVLHDFDAAEILSLPVALGSSTSRLLFVCALLFAEALCIRVNESASHLDLERVIDLDEEG